jgi:hypothetical protein
MPNNRKQSWTPLKIDFSRTENESTTAKAIIKDGTTQNDNQRPELAEAERRGNAESDKLGKTSSKKPEPQANPSSRISEASSTSRASMHYVERKDSDESYDPGDDDDIGAAYEDGEIERDHRTRATGRKVEYHKRYNTSQRSRK